MVAPAGWDKYKRVRNMSVDPSSYTNEGRPECKDYTINPSPYSIRCRRCNWTYVCICLFKWRRLGWRTVFADSTLLQPQKGDELNGSLPVGEDMFVEPHIIDIQDWSKKLEDFPLYNTIEEIDWDLLEKVGIESYYDRHKMAKKDKNPYPICIWCTYLKKCNGSLMAFLKAKRIRGCITYKANRPENVT